MPTNTLNIYAHKSPLDVLYESDFSLVCGKHGKFSIYVQILIGRLSNIGFISPDLHAPAKSPPHLCK